MRTVRKWLAGIWLWVIASPTQGGLVVTSYRTLAQTNGYAPTSQTHYFAEQRLENITPADAQVSADWTGPNADGTPNTWHFVGNSHATSVTTITGESYTVQASASFSYQVDTTAAFMDPRSITKFGPAGTGQYRGFFESDTPILYSITAQLNQGGRVRLSSFAGNEIFDESNPDPAPRQLNLNGAIPPGRYQLLAAAGLSSPILPNGVTHYAAGGSFENLVFTARVHEPTLLGLLVATATQVMLRRGSW